MIIAARRTLCSGYKMDGTRAHIHPIDVEIGWTAEVEDADEAIQLVENGEIPVTLRLKLQSHHLKQDPGSCTISYASFTASGKWVSDGDMMMFNIEVPYQAMKDQGVLNQILNQILQKIFGVNLLISVDYVITR